MSELSDTSAVRLPEPWRETWPEGGLEVVPACPACSATERQAWHSALKDNTYLSARGFWSMWRCTRCGAGYLDPRPNEQTIHMAYGSYYTHEDQGAPVKRPSALRRLRQALTNGYTRDRFGARNLPASSLGVLAIGGVPLLRKRVDREFRHLPQRTEGSGAVLDIGCGDGAFLALARDCGWTVLGLEPDPKAAQQAAQRGVTVIEGGLECVKDRSEAFDVITLAHVIEHVHNPLEVLKDCRRLLKPGGQLWLETPNANSLGHRYFGADWRGLEAPRHLVLFTRKALLRLLQEAGFESVAKLPCASPRRWIFQHSLAMQEGRHSEDVRSIPLAWRLRALAGDLREFIDDRHSEHLTVSAKRPK